MLGLEDLKGKIVVTETTVECPVKGCPEIVMRQRTSFKREPQYQCPRHKIFISPTTFEYADEQDNLLWKSEADRSLLQAVGTVKRESRLARDNSEDAVTWNVFRYLERSNLLSALMSSLIGFRVTCTELIYWSYSQKNKGPWPGLVQTSSEFGERLARRSEPDLIVVSDRALFWIEAKLTATNSTTPSNPSRTKAYLTGGNKWFQKVFKSDYETVVIKDELYELMRFWLLGSWIATQMDCDFYLLNLVLAEREKSIDRRFGKHLAKDPRRRFLRLSWEDIQRFVCDSAAPTQERNLLLTHFENKTIGYNHRGELQPAFSFSGG